MCPELLDELLWWFNLGDGRFIKLNSKYPNGNARRSVFTVSTQLIHDLHEILFKSGGSGYIKYDSRKNCKHKFPYLSYLHVVLRLLVIYHYCNNFSLSFRRK